MNLSSLVQLTHCDFGLMPGRTKPLHEPVLTYHQLRHMASYCIIIRKSKDTNQQHNIEKWIFTITSQSPRCQWVNGLFLCWFKAIVWTNANFIGEPLRNLIYSNKFLFEIKIFAFTKTRLHNFNHFFKDLWVAIIGIVNILDVMGRK